LKNAGGDIFGICRKMLNERTEQENNTVIKYMKQTFSVFDEIPDD